MRMDDLEAARRVRDRVDVPIALDESVREPRHALAAVKAGAADIFVVKLMKSGGILNALKINAIAEAAAVGVMVGNMGESSLGLAAHFHIAAALSQRHALRRRRAVAAGRSRARYRSRPRDGTARRRVCRRRSRTARGWASRSTTMRWRRSGSSGRWHGERQPALRARREG